MMLKRLLAASAALGLALVPPQIAQGQSRITSGPQGGYNSGEGPAQGKTAIQISGGNTALDRFSLALPTIVLTGGLTSNATITLPQNLSGSWNIVNETTGAFTVSVGVQGSAASLALPQGQAQQITSDGVGVSLASSNSGAPFMAIGNGATAPSSAALRAGHTADIVDDFNADPTGLTGSDTAIQHACASGLEVSFPRGVYNITPATAQFCALAAGTQFIGPSRGKATIATTINDSSYHVVFNASGGDFHSKNLKYTFGSNSSPTVALFLNNSDGFWLEDVAIDGGMQQITPTATAATYNSTTGILSLTFASAPFGVVTPSAGANVLISGVTGTGGGVSSLNGTFPISSFGSSGAVVNVQAPTSLTASGLSGAVLTYINWAFFPTQFHSTIAATNTNINYSEIDNASYVGEKNNSDTSTDTGIYYRHDYIKNSFGGILFNSPNGACKTFLVDGVTFDTNPWTGSGGAAGFLLSDAGCTDGEIAHVKFLGSAYQAMHFEETSANVKIHDFDINGAFNTAILSIPNNISGSYHSPSNFDIHDGTITNTASQAAGVMCINAGLAAPGGPGLIKSKLHDVTCDNWTTGIFKGADASGELEVYRNTIRNTSTALNLQYADGSTHDNYLADDTVGVQVNRGGTLGKQIFQNVTTPFFAPTGTSGAYFAFNGAHFIAPPVSSACVSAAVDTPIFSLVKVAYYGNALASISGETSSIQSSIDYSLVGSKPGSGFTYTSAFSAVPGNYAVSVTEGGTPSFNLNLHWFCNTSATTTLTGELDLLGIGMVYQ